MKKAMRAWERVWDAVMIYVPYVFFIMATVLILLVRTDTGMNVYTAFQALMMMLAAIFFLIDVRSKKGP